MRRIAWYSGGETFRPAYWRLGAVRPALLKSKPPGTKIAIAAFTATSDPPQAQIIQQVLQLQQPDVFRQNPYGKICTEMNAEQ